MAYTPEVYILGNAHIFMTALEGLQAIFDPTAGVTAWAGGNGPFPVGVLIKIALIVGLLFQAGRMMHTQQAEIRHVVVALLMYIALFVPSTSIILYNVYNGDTYKVDHVPIGIAYAGGFVSTMSYDLMNTFSQVDNFYTGAGNPLSLSQSGFVGPLKNLLGIQRFPTVMKDANPNLWYTMVSFAQHCNAGYKGFSVQNDVDNTESTDSVYKLMTTSGAYNADSNTYIFNSTYPWNGSGTGGEVVSCSIAATYLSASLQNYFGNVTTGSPSNQAGDIFSSNNDFNAALAKVENDHNYNYSSGGDISSTVESNIGNLFPACTGGGNGSQMTCTAADVGLEFMENTLEACAAKMGVYGATTSKAETDMVIGALPAFCTTMSGALAHQETTFAGMASSFLAFVGPMMTVLQFLFFALAPIVAVLFAFMGPGGPSYIAKYLMFGAWTQSFLPVAAIINNLAQYDAVNQMQHMLQSLMPSAGSTTEPFNLAQFDSISTVFSYASRNLATADMLLAFTPLLTAFVFTGSYFALTQLGNMIVNKEGLNKSQDVATPNMGATTFNQPVNGYGAYSTGTGEIGTTNASVQSSPTISLGAMVSAGAASALTQASNSVTSASKSLDSAGSIIGSQGFQHTVGSETAQNLSSSYSTMQDYNKKLASAWKNAFGTSSEEAHSVALGASLGVGPSLASLSNKIQADDKLTNTQKANLTSALENSVSAGHDFRNSLSKATTDSTGSKAAEQEMDSLNHQVTDAKKSAEQAQESYSSAAQLNRTAAAMENSGVSSAQNAQGLVAQLQANYKRDPAGAELAMNQVASEIKTYAPGAWKYAVNSLHGNTKGPANLMNAITRALQSASNTDPVLGASLAAYAMDKFGYGQSNATTNAAAIDEQAGALVDESAAQARAEQGQTGAPVMGTLPFSRSTLRKLPGQRSLAAYGARAGNNAYSELDPSFVNNAHRIFANRLNDSSLAGSYNAGNGSNSHVLDNTHISQVPKPLEGTNVPWLLNTEIQSPEKTAAYLGGAGFIKEAAIFGSGVWLAAHGSKSWREHIGKMLKNRGKTSDDADGSDSDGSAADNAGKNPNSNPVEPEEQALDNAASGNTPSPLEDLIEGKPIPLNEILVDE